MNSHRVSDGRERSQNTDYRQRSTAASLLEDGSSAAAVGNTDVLSLRENPERIQIISISAPSRMPLTRPHQRGASGAPGARGASG
jgi:hypothetical protein